MFIVDPAIEKYLDSLLPERNPVFLEMEKRAEKENFPAVGPHVGLLLQLLTRMISARNVLELGSGYGYSALWIAQALPESGRIILTDLSEKHHKAAIKYFKRLKLDHLMEFRVKNAVTVLAEETGPFDLIFNDVDKEESPEALELSHARLREGGLFVTDNTLWYGQVTQDEVDETTVKIKEFNCKLAAHPGFQTVQIPLRDGVSISIKK